MGKDKRYYYLKLEEDYFTNKVQKALRKLPSGADMCLCYLKMQLLGLRTNGVLVYDGIYESFEQEIAEEISEEVGIVKLTLEMLRRWKLIIDETENQIYMQEMQGRFGSTSDVALRVAKHREKQKLLQCNTDETNCNVIKEIEIDKEIDIDKEKDKEKIPYQQIADMYNNTCVSYPRLTKLSDARKKSIKARLRTYSIDDIQRVFTLAEQSDFLKGANNRNWSATFDWMMKDTNMAKILDGNYINKKSNSVESKQLPDWFNNQDLVQKDRCVDDNELSELLKKLEEK